MTSHHTPDPETVAYVKQRCRILAELHGRPPEAGRWALYAERLAHFPRFALAAAFSEVEMAGGDFYPSLAQIVAAVRHALQERGILETPDLALRRVRRELSRVAPPTRTEIAFSAPAIAACVARMGGIAAAKAALESPNDQTFDIARKEFLGYYAEECMSDDHLAFVAAHGAPAVPPPLRGLELPPGEVSRLVAHANDQMRELPPWLLERQDALPALPANAESQEAHDGPAR